MNNELINKIAAAKEIVVKSNLSETLTLFKNGDNEFIGYTGQDGYTKYTYNLEEVHDLLQGKEGVTYYNIWRSI